ncbi:DUF4192 family protein [Arthrobacter sp. D1-17]
MNAPEHLIISGPEDILGFVPHTLGYWPSRSLVAMTMQGKRLGATLRVDLPEAGPTDRGEDFAGTVAEYLLADVEADGSLLIFFTDDGWADAAGPPGSRALLAALEPALGLAGMPVRDAWYVGPEYWRNAYCTDPGCCPLPGRPLAEIRDSRLNAEMVYLGSSVGEAPGTGTPASPGSGKPAVMEAEERWALELCARRSSRKQFETVLDTWQAVLASKAAMAVKAPSLDTTDGAEPAPAVTAAPGISAAPGIPAAAGFPAAPGPASGGDLPCDIAGFLRATLRVPAWRDAVLVMAAAGRATARAGAEQFGIFSQEPVLPAKGPALVQMTSVHLASVHLPSGTVDAGETGQKASCPNTDRSDRQAGLPGYGEVLLGLSPALPDWNIMKFLEDVMLDLVACGPGEAEAAAWTSRGWIEWCRGRGSYAHASLSKALEAAPGYRLAELLSEVVRRGTICGWAGRKEAAWHRFGVDAA